MEEFWVLKGASKLDQRSWIRDCGSSKAQQVWTGKYGAASIHLFNRFQIPVGRWCTLRVTLIYCEWKYCHKILTKNASPQRQLTWQQQQLGIWLVCLGSGKCHPTSFSVSSTFNTTVFPSSLVSCSQLSSHIGSQLWHSVSSHLFQDQVITSTFQAVRVSLLVSPSPIAHIPLLEHKIWNS